MPIDLQRIAAKVEHSVRVRKCNAVRKRKRHKKKGRVKAVVKEAVQKSLVKRFIDDSALECSEDEDPEPEVVVERSVDLRQKVEEIERCLYSSVSGSGGGDESMCKK